MLLEEAPRLFWGPKAWWLFKKQVFVPEVWPHRATGIPSFPLLVPLLFSNEPKVVMDAWGETDQNMGL